MTQTELKDDLKYFTSDEIAECLKCSDTLYAYLWNEVLPLENAGHSLKDVFNDLPDHIKSELNSLEVPEF